MFYLKMYIFTLFKMTLFSHLVLWLIYYVKQNFINFNILYYLFKYIILYILFIILFYLNIVFNLKYMYFTFFCIHSCIFYATKTKRDKFCVHYLYHHSYTTEGKKLDFYLRKDV